MTPELMNQEVPRWMLGAAFVLAAWCLVVLSGLVILMWRGWKDRELSPSGSKSEPEKLSGELPKDMDGEPVKKPSYFDHPRFKGLPSAEVDRLNDLVKSHKLSVLDEDLRKTWDGQEIWHTHADELMQVQFCRLLRELVSATKQGNENRNH